MNRIALVSTLILAVCLIAHAEPPKPEVRTFEVTPAAPPTPALKYQLLFDDLGERRPGNAALLYFDAILLLGPDARDKTEKALDAYAAKDMQAFERLAGALEMPSVFQELELAGRREQCDWQPPFREMGAYTLLPHLEPLAHATTRLIKIKALRQIQQARLVDALQTLRLGYELGENVGQESILVSGLVSLRITSQMNDVLAQLLTQPDAPNLYWALREVPSRQGVLRKAFDGERQWFVAGYASPWSSPPGQGLAAAAKPSEKLSAEQWRAIIDYVWGIADVSGSTTEPAARHTHPDPVSGAGAETMRHAREDYAVAHAVTADAAAQVDPIIVIGEYYYHQYVIAFDEMYKLRGLPYPRMIAQAREAGEKIDAMHRDQPANPFLPVFNMGNVAATVGGVDRQIAALTAVEAIRAYAAANMGNLPARLEDATTTPIPENPMTGQPFEYRVDNDTATLTDSQGVSPLTYTIHLRK